MSWIFGCYRFDGVEESEIPTIPEKLQEHSLFESPRISIYSDTSSPIVYNSINENSGIVISGMGIDITDSQIYMGDSWAACESVESLDGQFVQVEWREEKLILSTDSVGLRKFYIYAEENYVLFSTRLDILTALVPDPAIDLNALGSYYSLIFSLRQHDTLIEQISSTSPGGRVILTPNRYHETVSQWQESSAADQDIVELLSKFTSVSDKNGYDTTLCFSAGLDSRTLLALMNSEIPGKFTNFCTGHESLPDLQIANEICRNEKLPLTTKLYNPEEIADLNSFLREISLRTNMLFGLENSLFFHGVREISRENSLLIDGAFGELLRAMLGNRLLFNGKEALTKSVPSVFPQYLGKPIPDFFAASAQEKLAEGSRDDCEEVFRNMPSINSIPLDKWVDLFVIRYRLAKEDSGYIDSIMPNIMPFAQNSVLSKMLLTPRTEKNHNRINRKIISGFYPRLMRYSLIRNDFRVPYFSCKNNYFSALLYTVLKKSKKGYSNDIALRMVLQCEKEIRQRLSSKTFENCKIYNHELIRELCEESLVEKRRDSAAQLLAFLNFDYWQQLCENREFTL